jgi:16S rRNA (adenine1518-N6/adenine1519-N6)-dimethyltransferase
MPEDVATPKGIRTALQELGLRPRRSLGQSFLADRGVRDRIVSEAGVVPGETVLEVGPGLGVLTEALAAAGARVVAVEKDEALADFVRRRLADRGVAVVVGDALAIDLAGLLPDGRARVVSNLPYAVATPLWVRLLPIVRGVGVFMVQAELADRLTARAGDRRRGAITVYTESWGRCEKAFTVPPSAFYPQPEVTSAVVRFLPGDGPPPPPALSRLVRLLFRFRRKTIARGLREALGLSPEEVAAVAAQLSFPLTLRPEALSLAMFGELLKAVGGERIALHEPDTWEA